MKKVTIVFTLLVFIAGFVNGQESQQKLHFGLKLAPVLSWTNIEVDGFEDDGSSVGFVYGLMTDFRFTDNYSFSTGLELSQRKGNSKTDIYSVKTNLQYIDIPVSLKLNTNQIGYMKYFGKFGFIPGFNVKASQDIDYVNPDTPDENDKKIGSDINIFNVGLIVGAGAEYNISGDTSIMVELLYNNGFIDVFKDDGQLKTSYFALNLGVYF
jgi:opacity protein-like surface antigen